VFGPPELGIIEAGESFVGKPRPKVDPIKRRADLEEAKGVVGRLRSNTEYDVVVMEKYFPLLFAAGILIDRSDEREDFLHVKPFVSKGTHAGNTWNTTSMLVEDTRVKGKLFRVYGGLCRIMVLEWTPENEKLYSDWDRLQAGTTQASLHAGYGENSRLMTKEEIMKECTELGIPPSYTQDCLDLLRPLEEWHNQIHGAPKPESSK
jgi:hypothetical protein